jgi:hypothetical protein
LKIFAWKQSCHYAALTFVLALYTPLETVRGLAEAVPVHLCVDELEDRDEAVFALRILRRGHERNSCVVDMG